MLKLQKIIILPSKDDLIDFAVLQYIIIIIIIIIITWTDRAPAEPSSMSSM